MLSCLAQEFNIEVIGELNDGIVKYRVPPNNLKSLTNSLKTLPELSFDMLLSITAVEKEQYFELNYILFSTKLNNELVISVNLSKENPCVDSICQIFSSANWEEREIYDLFGVKFSSHPNLTRLLLPKDWKGHPLRKDYKMDDERLVWNQ